MGHVHRVQKGQLQHHYQVTSTTSTRARVTQGEHKYLEVSQLQFYITLKGILSWLPISGTHSSYKEYITARKVLQNTVRYVNNVNNLNNKLMQAGAHDKNDIYKINCNKIKVTIK